MSAAEELEEEAPPAPETPMSAEPFLPESRSLSALRAAAAECRGCPLYAPARQTVFGEGPKNANLMFVGEQPGDQEDRQGRPFVGPAGRVLDKALTEVGLDRGDVYVTNAVKHFKFRRREPSKRRLHDRPRQDEFGACRPWLDAEIAVVSPTGIICLGASAAHAVLGRRVRIGETRGTFQAFEGADWVMVTTHPSSVLRASASGRREEAHADLVADLRLAVERLGG